MASVKSSWYDWQMYKFVRTIILQHNGTIFGGAIRDEIFHNIHADEFYKEENIYLHKNKNNPKAPRFDYNDIKISPHTIGRLTVPNDIDFYICKADLDKLLVILTKKFYVKIFKENELKYVMPHVDINKFKKLVIELVDISHNKTYKLKLDVISCLTNEAVPLLHDFDVNSLLWNTVFGIYTLDYMSHINIHNSAYKLINFNKIIENIKHKRANVMRQFIYNQTELLPKKDVWAYRFIKMVRNGWNINIPTIYYNFYTNIAVDNICIICSNTVIENKCKSYTNFKNCNCNLFICLSCLKGNYTKLDKCPLCRESIFNTTGIIEDNLLREISLFDMFNSEPKVHNLCIKCEPNSEQDSELDL